MSSPFQVTLDAASPRRLGLFWLAALEPDGSAVDPPPGSGPPDAWGPHAPDASNAAPS